MTAIIPGNTPCLRCVGDRPPPLGMNLTRVTVWVLAPIVHVVASLQVIAAMKILAGQTDSLNRKLVQVNAWTERHIGRTAVLCGSEAVQISAARDAAVDFEEIAARIAPVAKSAPQINRYLMRFEVDRYQIALFTNGRAIIKGTTEPDEGRSVYAKYIGG